MSPQTIDPRQEDEATDSASTDELEALHNLPSADRPEPVSADQLQDHFNQPSTEEPVYEHPGNLPDKNSPTQKTGSEKSANDVDSSAGHDGLAQKEAAAGETQGSVASSLYSHSGREFSNKGLGGLSNKLFVVHRRRTIAGGGILGTIIGLVLFFTLGAGPFQFIHIAELLQQFHFASLQNQQDDRFTKGVRLFRYAAKGQVENTRLGYLGNKYANQFEAKLNGSGLESSYTDKFGLFNGYVIDESNENFKDKTPDQIKEIVKENYGVDVVDGGTIKGASGLKGKLVIDASNLGVADTYKLNYGLLQEAGYSKLAAAIGARYLCARAACTSLLHPLTKAVGNGKRSLEDWWTGRNATDEEGSKPGELTPADDSPNQDGGAIGEEITAEEESPGSPTEINAKLAGGGAAALGLLCLARGIASQAHTLKANQVQVLMRMGVESLALGSQIQSGNDVNLSQLAQYNTLLSGKDAEGNNTSWDQSESIQANLGNPNTGEKTDPTLKDVTNDTTPFDFLINGVVGTALSTVCGTIGSIIQIIAGGLTGALQAIVFQAVLSQTHLASDLANWLAGSAINVDAVGADFGSEIDYGAALASNDQAMLAGGNTLSGAQSAAAQSTVNQLAQEKFNRQSTLHKLFSPYDEKSAISKVIDNASPSPTQNFAKIGSIFLNFGHMFSSLSAIFSGHAQAAGTGFDYGFPTIGFSQSDMADSSYANPYENACYVTGCSSENVSGQSQPIVGFLTGSSVDGAPINSVGQTYIDQAKACFGATISQDTVQTDQGETPQWNVTSSSGKLPNPYDDNYPKGCNDNTDKNWTRLRFFIMDTETMNSMSCYAGDDQACSDIGFGDSQPTSFAGSPISFAGGHAL